MAYAIHYLESHSIALITIWDRVNFDQMVRLQQEIVLLDQRTTTPLNILLMGHPQIVVTISAEELRTRAHSPTLTPGATRTIVASSDLGYGLARLFSSESEHGDQFSIVKDLASACALLNLDLGEVEAALPRDFKR